MMAFALVLSRIAQARTDSRALFPMCNSIGLPSPSPALRVLMISTLPGSTWSSAKRTTTDKSPFVSVYFRTSSSSVGGNRRVIALSPSVQRCPSRFTFRFFWGAVFGAFAVDISFTSSPQGSRPYAGKGPDLRGPLNSMSRSTPQSSCKSALATAELHPMARNGDSLKSEWIGNSNTRDVWL